MASRLDEQMKASSTQWLLGLIAMLESVYPIDERTLRAVRFELSERGVDADLFRARRVKGDPNPPTEYPVIKQCGCGRNYDATTWRRLHRIGFSVGCRDDRDVACELRNCECGSTISVVVDLEEVISVACGGADRERASAAQTAIDILRAT